MGNQLRSFDYFEFFSGRGPIAKKTTIVFVPFFGGTKEKLRRHIDFVNELGFPAVGFNLTAYDRLGSLWDRTWAPGLPRDRKGRWGIKFKWADEIEAVLDQIPGPKILYCFSSPTACALDATARRHAQDVCGVIGDCGPFVRLWECFENYIEFEMGVRSPKIRKTMNALFQPFWSLQHNSSLNADLRALPKGFPILSIRGLKDRLVTEPAINEAMAGHEHLALEILRLSSSDHLQGLKTEPELYKKAVGDFLLRIAGAN